MPSTVPPTLRPSANWRRLFAMLATTWLSRLVSPLRPPFWWLTTPSLTAVSLRSVVNVTWLLKLCSLPLWSTLKVPVLLRLCSTVLTLPIWILVLVRPQCTVPVCCTLFYLIGLHLCRILQAHRLVWRYYHVSWSPISSWEGSSPLLSRARCKGQARSLRCTITTLLLNELLSGLRADYSSFRNSFAVLKTLPEESTWSS